MNSGVAGTQPQKTLKCNQRFTMQNRALKNLSASSALRGMGEWMEHVYIDEVEEQKKGIITVVIRR